MKRLSVLALALLVAACQAPEEESMKDMIKYLTEFELKVAEGICEHLHPEMLFHHDDWGTENNSFLRPEMFADYFVEPYKEIYGYYHDHGVKVIVHHSDSYCANLVDYMIIAHWTADCDTPAAPDKVNNIAAFRNRVDGEGLYDGFIWNRHDTEATLGNYLGFGDVEKADSLTFGTSASPYGTPWNTLAKFGAAELNYQLLQNAEYRMVFADLVYRHVLRPDGALSADASAARYRARMEELDDAVVCEAARWGDGRTRAERTMPESGTSSAAA